MNWYTKISSKNIFIPDEIKSKIKTISNGIIDAWNNFVTIKDKQMLIDIIKFDENNFNIFLMKNNESVGRNTLSTTENNIIYLYFGHILIMEGKDKPKDYYINLVNELLLHEIIHNFDLKYTKRRNNFHYDDKNKSIGGLQDQDKYSREYHNFYPEFDAWSGQISSKIKNDILSGKLNKNNVYDILKSSNILSFIKIVGDYYAGFLNNINRKNVIKLKQRIWNDIKDLSDKE